MSSKPSMGWTVSSRLSSLVLFQKSPGVIDIHFLWTLCRYRRQGHMKLLLQHLIAEHPQGRIWLEVSDDNRAALSLYKGMGFEAVGERKAYYSSKATAHLLTL